jgi:serine/threonine-protein kinase
MPSKLFGYDVVDYVGEGAGSDIYAVTDPNTRQIYALKHVVPQKAKDQRFVEQVTNEFEVGRRFSHANLRRCFDFKVNRTLLRKVTEAALVMEMFDGQPLEFIATRNMRQLVGYFIQTARGLGAIHDEGLVHCDLKPSNILVSPSGHVKVIDYGQTCPVGTAKERIQGTPDYISPEQVKLAPVNERTDIFNLGATMYSTLCGQKLPTLYTLKRQENSFLVDDVIPAPHTINPEVPETLSNIVMECVRTNPAKRPADMPEVASRLEIIEHSLRKQGANARPVAV